MNAEQLELERAASMERRKKKQEAMRRERVVQEPIRGLSRKDRLRIRDDDYVPPPDAEAPSDGS